MHTIYTESPYDWLDRLEGCVSDFVDRRVVEPRFSDLASGACGGLILSRRILFWIQI